MNVSLAVNDIQGFKCVKLTFHLLRMHESMATKYFLVLNLQSHSTMFKAKKLINLVEI